MLIGASSSSSEKSKLDDDDGRHQRFHDPLCYGTEHRKFISNGEGEKHHMAAGCLKMTSDRRWSMTRMN